jgi:hypothetical protein
MMMMMMMMMREILLRALGGLALRGLQLPSTSLFTMCAPQKSTGHAHTYLRSEFDMYTGPVLMYNFAQMSGYFPSRFGLFIQMGDVLARSLS